MAEVEVPAGFVPQYALAFGVVDAPAVSVHAGNPLPVRSIQQPAGVTPLSGVTAANLVAGPYVPELARPIWVSLSGSWSGTAQLLRSIDGGTTKLPLTLAGEPWGMFTGPANEAVSEETEAGATFYLAISLSSGELVYRVAQ